MTVSEIVEKTVVELEKTTSKTQSLVGNLRTTQRKCEITTNLQTKGSIIEPQSPLNTPNTQPHVTFEFAPDKGSNHMQIFVEMKKFNSNIKMITSKGKVSEHPKELPSGIEYAKNFPRKTRTKKITKIYPCYNIESSAKMNQFKHGEINIMSTL